jgi:hypothetical protein
MKEAHAVDVGQEDALPFFGPVLHIMEYHVSESIAKC